MLLPDDRLRPIKINSVLTPLVFSDLLLPPKRTQLNYTESIIYRREEVVVVVVKVLTAYYSAQALFR